jgi:7-cyano-7-deazaguanine synthase
LQRPAEMSGPSKEVTEMDCTPEFIGAMAGAIYVGTYHQVRLETPLEWMAKRDVVLRGAELGVPFAITHSCYEGLRPACGKCPTCVERLAAFEAAGLIDPLEYAEGSDQRGDW